MTIPTPLPLSVDGAKTFEQFSTTHAVVIVAFFGAVSLAIALGRRHRGTPTLAAWERRVGVAFLALWCVSTVYWLLPRNYNVHKSWPLHMCDLVSLVAPFVLLTSRRWLRALLYYWGLGLSSQGFVTPTLNHGPGTLVFWLFWMIHAAIVGTAIYDLVVRRYRPGWRDFAVGASAAAAYAVAMLAIDIPLHLNYGFVGNLPAEQPTIVDRLGPWPGRVVILSGIVLAWMVVMTVPWVVARRVSRQAPHFREGEAPAEPRSAA